jgi:hypothetical protein
MNKLEKILKTDHAIDNTIIYELRKNEDIEAQLLFWKPIIESNNDLYNFLKQMSYYDVYHKYKLQKDIGIKSFYDFAVTEFIRSEWFDCLDEWEQDFIQTLLKGRLQ